MSDSVRPHRQQPTRLPHPWDSPGKNTGVGCHFLLQCMKVKIESEVAQSCPTLSYPMDRSLPGSSIHGIFQARVLEWGAIAFSDKPHSTAKKNDAIQIQPPPQHNSKAQSSCWQSLPTLDPKPLALPLLGLQLWAWFLLQHLFFRSVFLLTLLGEAQWLKLPTLAKHHSNHLHELFYDRRSW